MFYVTLCYFVLVFFTPFSIAITSLGEERANLSAFRTLFDLCLFGFVGFLSSWCLGRAAVVIVVFPGLFSYLFFSMRYGEKMQ